MGGVCGISKECPLFDLIGGFGQSSDARRGPCRLAEADKAERCGAGAAFEGGKEILSKVR